MGANQVSSDISVWEIASKNAANIIWLLTHQHAMIRDYANRWLAGERWESITLNDEGLVTDGSHRLCAAILLGHDTISGVSPGQPGGVRGYSGNVDGLSTNEKSPARWPG